MKKRKTIKISKGKDLKFPRQISLNYMFSLYEKNPHHYYQS